MSFKNKLLRLEEITLILEKGDCEIEQAMELYSEGVNLIKECSNTIEQAKLKVVENDIK